MKGFCFMDCSESCKNALISSNTIYLKNANTLTQQATSKYTMRQTGLTSNTTGYCQHWKVPTREICHTSKTPHSSRGDIYYSLLGEWNLSPKHLMNQQHLGTHTKCLLTTGSWFDSFFMMMGLMQRAAIPLRNPAAPRLKPPSWCIIHMGRFSRDTTLLIKLCKWQGH